ncbi:MAG TPA: hypothetical protein VMO47_06695, partial [Rhodothermales bacterium]|nr:hypothetical protein [Rhodothermales bacterium]
LPRIQWKNDRLFLTLPDPDDSLFFETMFKPLLGRISELPHRYVIKEVSGKTRVIIQEVLSLEKVEEVMDEVASAVTVGPASHVTAGRPSV